MSHKIKFEFNLRKSLSVMAYFLRETGETDKLKLIKLLYIADRESFLQLGQPLTGDQQFALKYGPVPSQCLDAINGNIDPDEVFRIIHVNDEKITLRDDAPEQADLSREERDILDQILATYKDVPTGVLVRKTHAFPEYREAYVENTSRPIPYEAILKHHGTEAHFRNGRPVISTKMAPHMISPFVFGSEPDL